MHACMRMRAVGKLVCLRATMGPALLTCRSADARLRSSPRHARHRSRFCRHEQENRKQKSQKESKRVKKSQEESRRVKELCELVALRAAWHHDDPVVRGGGQSLLTCLESPRPSSCLSPSLHKFHTCKRARVQQVTHRIRGTFGKGSLRSCRGLTPSRSASHLSEPRLRRILGGLRW